MRRVVLSLCLAFLLPSVIGQSAEVVGSLPVAVVGGAGVATPQGLLVLGGRVESGTYTNAIQRFDPATGAAEEWGWLPPAEGASSPGRGAAAAVLLGDAVYVFGGVAEKPFMLPGRTGPTPVPTSIDEILRVDLATGHVERLLDRLPQGRWGVAAVAHGGVAYLAGGFSFDIGTSTFGRHGDVLVFDPAAVPGLRVSTFGRLPHAVQDAVAAVVHGRLVVAGGLADHTNETHVNECPSQRYTDEDGEAVEAPVRACRTDAIVTIDLASRAVTVEDARLPSRVQWAGGAVVDGRLLVAGGGGEGGVPLGGVAAWSSDGVEAFPVPLAAPVLGPAAAGHGGALVLLGGRGEDVWDVRPTVQRWSPAPATLPAAPRALDASASAAGVLLSWSLPADASAVTGYRVARNGVVLAETTNASFFDAGAPRGLHRYAVTTLSADGAGGAAIIAAGHVDPPGAPRDLRARTTLALLPVPQQSACLSWAPPADHGGARVFRYHVWREDVRVGETSERSWCETAPLAPTTYRVTAVNRAGEGAASEPAVARPLAPLPS